MSADVSFEGFRPTTIEEFERIERKRLHPHSIWAEDAIAAFLAMTDDVVEITKWPEGKSASQITTCLKNNIVRLHRVDDMKAVMREGQVFLLRKAKAGKVVSMPSPGKKRIPMPQSSAGLKKAVR